MAGLNRTCLRERHPLNLQQVIAESYNVNRSNCALIGRVATFFRCRCLTPERANVSHTVRASAPPLQLRLLAVGAADLAHGFEQVNVVAWNSRKVRSFVAKTLSCLLGGCRHS